MLSNLKLAPKFTLLLSLVFISTIGISGLVLSKTTQQQAEGDVAYRGQILMEVMSSVRNYTEDEVNPILEPRIEKSNELIFPAIPSYSVRKVFENFRKNPKYKDYLYKDALLNPTNSVRDTANPLERKIIEDFRTKSGLKKELGFTNRQGENVFYYAQPIVITNPSCLRCHSTPAAAPKKQLDIYGSEHGFGWTLNRVLGTQIIYVPSEEVFALARQNLTLAMSIFIGIFALVILLINFLLKQAVVQPIRPMARLAHKISSEQFSSDQDEESDIKSLGKASKNSDELGQLARVFQQMAHAIYTREQNFAQQLEQLRTKSEQMQSRTSSRNNKLAYFKALQEKAQMIRNRAK
jgi:methyl-accepting chemotaxis protein